MRIQQYVYHATINRWCYYGLTKQDECYLQFKNIGGGGGEGISKHNDRCTCARPVSQSTSTNLIGPAGLDIYFPGWVISSTRRALIKIYIYIFIEDI